MLDRINKNIILAAVVCICLSLAVRAQTSEFTFQGKLTDQSAPANGVYDLTFALHDAANIQMGNAILLEDVQVANGIFTVRLDFGAAAFDGGERTIEIAVRPGSSSGAFTILSPRQPVGSVPYAVLSKKAATADTATNATQLGGINADQFVQSDDGRLADARNPLPGSGSYVQNTSVRQSGSQFNISGNGIAGGLLSGADVNAESIYRLTGIRFLGSNFLRNSVYLGFNAGSQGDDNTFAGYSTGFQTSARGNSLFGSHAGERVTTGEENSVFGYLAGSRLTTGKWNSFFGGKAGGPWTETQITGYGNSIFGYGAGSNLGPGVGNTLIGMGSNVGSGGIVFSTAIGYGAVVDQSNSVSIGDSTAKVGVGAAAPQHKLEVIDPANTGLRVQTNQPGGTVASFGGFGEFRVDAQGIPGGRFVVRENGSVGIGTAQPSKPLEVLGDIRASSFSPGSYPRFSLFYPHPSLDMRKWQMYTTGDSLNFSALNNDENAETVWMQVSRSSGINLGRVVFPNSVVALDVLGTSGGSSLCINTSNQIARCSSSIRYKDNILDYRAGLDLVRQLRPVSFNWKSDGKADVGFVAEEVAAVEPLLASRDEKGEIEGVKYDRITTALVNAVNEQQSQLDAQSATIELQQKQIDALTKLVCASNPEADHCRAKGGQP